MITETGAAVGVCVTAGAATTGAGAAAIEAIDAVSVFRYAVAAAEGARTFANSLGEALRPPEEGELTTGAATTGQALVVKVVSVGYVDVPAGLIENGAK